MRRPLITEKKAEPNQTSAQLSAPKIDRHYRPHRGRKRFIHSDSTYSLEKAEKPTHNVCSSKWVPQSGGTSEYIAQFVLEPRGIDFSLLTVRPPPTLLILCILAHNSAYIGNVFHVACIFLAPLRRRDAQQQQQQAL